MSRASAVLRFSCAALVLLANAAAGLDPGTALSQYGHSSWRVREGYFAGPPLTVAQTRDGFLWIGTEAGLIRFDGVRFLPWQPPAGSRLPHDRIVALLGASDGSLWIGTGNGLARWRDGKLAVYAQAGRFGALLEDHQGTIWAGHTRALKEIPPLCRFARGEFQCLGLPDETGLRYVGALHEDRQGDLWIGGESGVCRWRPQKPDCYPIESLAALKPRTGVFALAGDSEGGLWTGAGVMGLWRLTAGRWQPYPGAPEPVAEADSMLSDRGGALWLGTSSGLIRRVQGRTERFTRADGLSGDSVNDMVEDREGNVWIATSAGLDRFRDAKVATLTPREGLPGGTILAVVAAKDGSVWATERHALIHLEGAGISVYGAQQGLPGVSTTSVLEDSEGRIWVGVDNGLAWREHGRFFPLRMPDGSALGVVRTMVEDREGNLWVATTHPTHPLLRIRDQRVAEEFSAERLGAAQVSVMTADLQGGVWLGLSDSLRLYRNGNFESHGSVREASEVHGLLADARGLWVATNQGLGLLGNGRLSTLGIRNGLPCNDIESVVPGDDGSLWLKAACGLIQIAPGELISWAERPDRRVQTRLLDAFDGVQAGLPPFAPRAAKSLDGRMWFALETGGLQVFDPKNMKGNTIPPPVTILQAVADRKAYPTGSALRLPPLTRDVEIDYTALSLSVPEKVRFRYRLEGADADWREAGTRREAFYTNLGPGKYRFRVVACNNDGVWSPEGAALDIAILPAFHQTWAFFALCAAALVGLAWSAYRWRVRQVRASLDRTFEERLAERTRIAQDLHDTLLQGLLSASMQLYSAVEELPAAEPARSRFERVQQLMHQVIDEGRGALRGLRSADQGADDLETSLARIPGELGAPEAVDFRIVTEGRPRLLLPVVRDEIYRIAREALVNAFRHAGASTIEVEIEYAARQIRIMVRDDGGGIDESVLQAGREGHWGLSGMRERAERIGAPFHVWSRAGSGTEIELAVPGTLAYADGRRSVFSWWAGRRRDHDLAAAEKPGVERERSRPEQDDDGGHQGDEDRGRQTAQDVGDGPRQ